MIVYYKRMKKIIVFLLIAILLVGGGIGIGKFVLKENKIANTEVNKDKYIVFALEIWDQVKENYWEKISDDEMSNIYLLAVDKLSGTTHALKTKDRAGVEALLTEVMKDIKDDKKKEFTATLGDMVLANLKPFGRSRLYAEKDQKALSNTVNNVNPGIDRFADLGVGKSATDTEIKAAFDKKTKEATTAAQKQTVAQAYEVLKDKTSRQTYETSGVEPTIEYKLLAPSIFYTHLTKFSPTTLEEFARVTSQVDKGTTLDTLIFDLRGNIGGAIDGLPYFLGPFIGPDTLGYQFYRQGEKENYFTKTGWMNSLVRYNKVIVLIDENSQSTAEVMAASLKKYNVGVVVGVTTKGWGTVERVFPMKNQIADDEKFSLFMVHRVTLRDDGQPIEGRGVDPNISIKDTKWRQELLEKYNFPEIVKAIEGVYTQK